MANRIHFAAECSKEQEQKFLVEINRLMELASTDVVENRMRAEVAIGACG